MLGINPDWINVILRYNLISSKRLHRLNKKACINSIKSQRQLIFY